MGLPAWVRLPAPQTLHQVPWDQQALRKGVGRMDGSSWSPYQPRLWAGGWRGGGAGTACLFSHIDSKAHRSKWEADIRTAMLGTLLWGRRPYSLMSKGLQGRGAGGGRGGSPAWQQSASPGAQMSPGAEGLPSLLPGGQHKGSHRPMHPLTLHQQSLGHPSPALPSGHQLSFSVREPVSDKTSSSLPAQPHRAATVQCARRVSALPTHRPHPSRVLA